MGSSEYAKLQLVRGLLVLLCSHPDHGSAARRSTQPEDRPAAVREEEHYLGRNSVAILAAMAFAPSPFMP